MAFGRLMHEHNTTPSVRFLLQKCRKCFEMCTLDQNSFPVTSDELNFEDVYKIHLAHLDQQSWSITTIHSPKTAKFADLQWVAVSKSISLFVLPKQRGPI